MSAKENKSAIDFVRNLLKRNPLIWVIIVISYAIGIVTIIYTPMGPE